ncbi:hypothetical protein MMC28_008035 [Mycoblastus sanguinarius]|nr:hypothetical protein [Mycoblastus sanguinarius]
MYSYMLSLFLLCLPWSVVSVPASSPVAILPALFTSNHTNTSDVASRPHQPEVYHIPNTPTTLLIALSYPALSITAVENLLTDTLERVNIEIVTQGEAAYLPWGIYHYDLREGAVFDARNIPALARQLDWGIIGDVVEGLLSYMQGPTGSYTATFQILYGPQEVVVGQGYVAHESIVQSARELMLSHITE